MKRFAMALVLLSGCTFLKEGPVELTPTQFAALVKVHDIGQVSQNQLGRLTAMDPATIQGVIQRLEARKLIERARGALMSAHGMSEPEAFRWIQKTAMDLRLSMRQVAEGVVEHGPGIAAS